MRAGPNLCLLPEEGVREHNLRGRRAVGDNLCLSVGPLPLPACPWASRAPKVEISRVREAAMQRQGGSPPRDPAGPLRRPP